jgi:hypothetical protein
MLRKKNKERKYVNMIRSLFAFLIPHRVQGILNKFYFEITYVSDARGKFENITSFHHASI